MLRNTKLIFAFLMINTRAAVAMRVSFFLSCIFMFLNNLIFFATWIILFQKVDNIGGWTLSDCALMYGLVACSFGIAVIVRGGLLDLARTIEEGDLDSFLSQPIPPLVGALCRKTIVSGWGDLLSGALLIGASGKLGLWQLPLLALALLGSATLFIAVAILFHSIAFWARNTRGLLWQAYEFVMTFSLYPGPIYSGWLKVVVYTILPAGFISSVPVEMVRNGSSALVLIFVTAILCYVGAAIVVFNRGLRRYSSGSRIGSGV